jgi:hypothetical protein
MTVEYKRPLTIELFNERGESVAKIKAAYFLALNSFTQITESISNRCSKDHYLIEKLTGVNSIDGLTTLYYQFGGFIEISRA